VSTGSHEDLDGKNEWSRRLREGEALVESGGALVGIDASSML
jgi:hypothetical protein